jgi:hypothetical protein
VAAWFWENRSRTCVFPTRFTADNPAASNPDEVFVPELNAAMLAEAAALAAALQSPVSVEALAPNRPLFTSTTIELPAGSDHGLPEPEDQVTVSVADTTEAPSGSEEVSKE